MGDCRQALCEPPSYSQALRMTLNNGQPASRLFSMKPPQPLALRSALPLHSDSALTTTSHRGVPPLTVRSHTMVQQHMEAGNTAEGEARHGYPLVIGEPVPGMKKTGRMESRHAGQMSRELPSINVPVVAREGAGCWPSQSPPSSTQLGDFIP